MGQTDESMIRLTPAEITSGVSRQRWAEGLIQQLPQLHEGRNSWLLNYGLGTEARRLREKHRLAFDPSYDAAADAEPDHPVQSLASDRLDPASELPDRFTRDGTEVLVFEDKIEPAQWRVECFDCDGGCDVSTL